MTFTTVYGPSWTPEQLAEQDAIWAARLVTHAHNAAQRFCSWCYRLKVDGQCVTKGCPATGYDPRSGFGPRAPSQPGRCVQCGTVTSDRYVYAVDARQPTDSPEGVPWLTLYRCPACERDRNRAQAQATITKPEVLEHIRASAERYLKEDP